MNILELVLGIAFATCALTTAPEGEVRNHLQKQIEPFNLALNVAGEYGSWMLTTAGHEYGHALAIKAFTGNLPTIHLGSHKTGIKPLFSIGNLSIDGLNPMIGYTDMPTQNLKELQTAIAAYIKSNPSLEKKIMQLMATQNPALESTIAQITKLVTEKLSLLTNNQRKAVLLAGGFAGAATRLGMQATGKILGFSSYPLHMDALVCHQLFNALLPVNADFDAAKFWKLQLNLSDKQIGYASNVCALIYAYSFMHTTLNDPRNNPHTPKETLLLLGLANYYLRGIARFHG